MVVGLAVFCTRTLIYRFSNECVFGMKLKYGKRYLAYFQRIPLPQGKVSGGSSSLNGLIYQRGSRHIYDWWSQNGAQGWAFKDVLKYFRRSEDIKVPELMKSSQYSFY